MKRKKDEREHFKKFSSLYFIFARPRHRVDFIEALGSNQIFSFRLVECLTAIEIEQDRERKER